MIHTGRSSPYPPGRRSRLVRLRGEFVVCHTHFRLYERQQLLAGHTQIVQGRLILLGGIGRGLGSGCAGEIDYAIDPLFQLVHRCIDRIVIFLSAL